VNTQYKQITWTALRTSLSDTSH